MHTTTEKETNPLNRSNLREQVQNILNEYQAEPGHVPQDFAEELQNLLNQDRQNDLLNVVEFAQLCDVHPETIRRRIRAGKLDAERIDKGSGKGNGCLIQRGKVYRHKTKYMK